MCRYVSVCVVFVALLVVSVLASMRWLLCGGDGSEKTKTTSVITKNIPRENFSMKVFLLIRKNENRIKLQSLRFYINS